MASDQAAVNAAQLAVTDATLLAPADGLITAVNILPGVSAPSGYAIEESVGPMVATASFAESAITGLAVGQSATVGWSPVPDVSVPGTLTQIVPVASSSGSSGGTGSSVATYAVHSHADRSARNGAVRDERDRNGHDGHGRQCRARAGHGPLGLGHNGLHGRKLVNANGGTSSVAVQVGVVTTSYAQITSGLSAGDTVVVGSTTTRNSTTTTTSGVNLSGLTGGGGCTGPAGGFGGR